MNLTRQEKRERRRQILRIIGDRSVEALSDQELKSVQEIAETIGADTMDQSKPTHPDDDGLVVGYDGRTIVPFSEMRAAK